MALDHAAIVVLRRGLRLEHDRAREQWVLLFPEGVVELNESAAAILGECREPVTVSELVGRLQARYPEAGPIGADIEEFLGVARDKGWVDVD